MKSFRTIMQTPTDSITIELPPEFRLRQLEVIVTLVPGTEPMPSAWPDGFLARISGGWRGEPLLRPPQGEYENRQQLE